MVSENRKSKLRELPVLHQRAGITIGVPAQIARDGRNFKLCEIAINTVPTVSRIHLEAILIGRFGMSLKRVVAFDCGAAILCWSIQMYSFGSLLYMVYKRPCDLCSAIIQLTMI
jgi:hypothetical protein